MPASERTDAKLRYAEAILRDLRQRAGQDGDDFQRAREEAFLFHLHGARDAFLHEVNEHHGCGLAPNEVKLWSLEKALRARGRTSQQLTEIGRLESQPTHALHRLKEWRDASTHRGGVPRAFFVGGPEDGQRRFQDPTTGKPTGQHLLDDFETMLADMRVAISRFRADLSASPP
jgi:hypothetical protein